MPSFGEMVDEVTGHLRAYSMDQESKSSLLTALDTVQTTVTVADPDRMSAGLAEIDDELVEVSSIDATTGVVTMYPWGRGQQSTTPTAHAINTRITVTPRWPRSRVKKVINEIISGVWPDLFAVRTFNLTSRSDLRDEYEVPADVRRILTLRWNDPVLGWQNVPGWRVNQGVDTTDGFTTGTTVEIDSGMVWPGYPIRGVYAAEPTPLVNDADDYATVTGLPDGSSDLICLGAAARLVLSADLSRTQLFTVEHQQRTDAQGAGSGAAASRYLMQLYQVRLQAERARLFEKYPIRQRRTW